MNDFLEDRLKDALRRKDAPEGLAERVLIRVQAVERRQPKVWFAAAAAVFVAGLLLYGAFGQHRQQKVHEEANARNTERQVVFALALAMEKVQHVNARLQQNAPKMAVEKRGEKL